MFLDAANGVEHFKLKRHLPWKDAQGYDRQQRTVTVSVRSEPAMHDFLFTRRSGSFPLIQEALNRIACNGYHGSMAPMVYIVVSSTGHVLVGGLGLRRLRKYPIHGAWILVGVGTAV